MFPGKLGLERTKHLLGLINNPQDRVKIIHIAGTSGKGSTCYLISRVLSSLGFKVGLHLSPHLQDIRERTQINNKLISKQKFVEYLNQIASYLGSCTYFEILTALAFYTFWKEKVDYAVIETGLGGLYDATNTVNSRDKLVILTRIGKDHTHILGDTLTKIALQKAEIIQKDNSVIALFQKPQINQRYEEISKKRSAKLYYIRKGVNFKNVEIDISKTIFDFTFKDTSFSNIHLGLLGKHQAENCSLALAAVLLLSNKDNFEFNKQKIKYVLKSAYFPGRLDLFNINDRVIILDGAHNPQKISTLTKSLIKMFSGQKLNFLLAFKRDKDSLNLLKNIVRLANHITITSFFIKNQDLFHLSKETKEIEKDLKKLNFRNFKIVENPKQAFKYALENGKNPLVITGSLYLISEIYPLCYTQ